MQACRYSNVLASESSIGLEMLPFPTASSISALKRQSTLGLVIKKRKIALIAVAVVSVPAALYHLTLARISADNLIGMEAYI